MQVDALGNELHFNYKFEDLGFRAETPRRRAPQWVMQQVVCAYCLGVWKEGREGGVVMMYGQMEGDWYHGVLWFLACTKRMEEEGGLSESDQRLVKMHVELAKREWLTRMVQVFLGEREIGKVEKWWEELMVEQALEKEKRVVKSRNMVLFFLAFYMGLYYDAVERDELKRGFWFDRCMNVETDEDAEFSDDDLEYDVRRFLARVVDLKLIGRDYSEEIEKIAQKFAVSSKERQRE